MTKLLLIASLSLFLVSCQNTGENCPQNEGSTDQAAACPTTPTPQEPIPEPLPGEDVPAEALRFDASINFVNFDGAAEDKVHRAIDIIKRVVASPEFKARVLNFTYQGKKQFLDNKGYTNGQIYQILLNGREELKPEIDHEMDLELELYYSSRNTVGYTYPNTIRIWMNTKYFNPYTPSEVAGNVFHEWTHKLGFTHASSYSVARDSSVPYAIGYLIEELGKQYE